MVHFPFHDEDYDLWLLVAQVRQAMFRARRKELVQYNISPRQAAVLFAIQAIDGKATPAEISRWLFREPHSVSELLSRMEKRGLVRKVKDLKGKNLVRLVLTEKGCEAYYQSTKRESIHKIKSSLTEEERQQLRSCLQILRDKAVQVLRIEDEMPFPPSR